MLNIISCKEPLVPLSDFQNVRSLKILGVLFNEKLAWCDHVNFVVKTASQRLYILRILKRTGTNKFSHDKLVVVFHVFILSLLDYAS